MKYESVKLKVKYISKKMNMKQLTVTNLFLVLFFLCFIWTVSGFSWGFRTKKHGAVTVHHEKTKKTPLRITYGKSSKTPLRITDGKSSKTHSSSTQTTTGKTPLRITYGKTSAPHTSTTDYSKSTDNYKPTYQKELTNHDIPDRILVYPRDCSAPLINQFALKCSLRTDNLIYKQEYKYEIQGTDFFAIYNDKFTRVKDCRQKVKEISDQCHRFGNTFHSPIECIKSEFLTSIKMCGLNYKDNDHLGEIQIVTGVLRLLVPHEVTADIACKQYIETANLMCHKNLLYKHAYKELHYGEPSSDE